jgi:hypothetical protein
MNNIIIPFRANLLSVQGFTNFKSCLFDGVDDVVELGTSADLELIDDFSVSLWIKDASALNRGVLCCSSRSAANGWQIQRTTANKISFYCAARTAISTTLINTDTWFNVIATWEKNVGGGIGNRVRIYVNGTLEGTATRLSTLPPTYTGTIYKQIAFPYAGSNNFEGGIDEVAVYDRLLTPTEISEISATPIDLSDYTPLAYYRMGDNDIFPTLTDNGSGGNNGTLTNMDAADIVNDVPA